MPANVAATAKVAPGKTTNALRVRVRVRVSVRVGGRVSGAGVRVSKGTCVSVRVSGGRPATAKVTPGKTTNA